MRFKQKDSPGTKSKKLDNLFGSYNHLLANQFNINTSDCGILIHLYL